MYIQKEVGEITYQYLSYIFRSLHALAEYLASYLLESVVCIWEWICQAISSMGYITAASDDIVAMLCCCMCAIFLKVW